MRHRKTGGKRWGNQTRRWEAAGGVPQGQMSASLCTWSGSPLLTPLMDCPRHAQHQLLPSRWPSYRSCPNATQEVLLFLCEGGLPSLLYSCTLRNSYNGIKVDKFYTCRVKAECPTGRETCPLGHLCKQSGVLSVVNYWTAMASVSLMWPKLSCKFSTYQ